MPKEDRSDWVAVPPETFENGGGGTTTATGTTTSGMTGGIAQERNKAPTNGEKTREFAGKKWYWCGKCKRWMKTDHAATPQNCPKNAESGSSGGSSGVHTVATSLPMTGLSG